MGHEVTVSDYLDSMPTLDVWYNLAWWSLVSRIR